MLTIEIECRHCGDASLFEKLPLPDACPVCGESDWTFAAAESKGVSPEEKAPE